ncbi:MAG: hypothetical protein J0L54_10520 [Chitinophagales bacterium]|nr:hypothetical protein [Chitinophagales bacterium]
MIKQSILSVAFFATLVEKHRQPDIVEKTYPHIMERFSPFPVYGKIEFRQSNTITLSEPAILVTT